MDESSKVEAQGEQALPSVLLATDGGEGAEAALHAAIKLANTFKVALTAVTMAVSNPEYDAVAPQAAADAERRAREVLDHVVAEAKAAGLACATRLRRGAAPDRDIVEVAKEFNAQLIVMGRHERGKLSRTLLGDTAGKVIAHAPCCVLVVPAGAAFDVRRVLVATDGSEVAEKALPMAARLAHYFAAPITAVSVEVPSHPQERRAEAAQIVQRTVEWFERAKQPCDGEVLNGEVAEAVTEAARRLGADVIVMASHGRTGLGRVVVGSNASRVLEKSDCAVLVVRGG
ncbi:MAG: universal stress protein [Burkholderiales bacterium]|nr:MAG: universal stress protein [Burkholderiales bacterium]